MRTHVMYMSRSPIEIMLAVASPLIYATLAFYLFRAADRPDQLLQASVGAGLMGVWSSVLFGSGGAVQNQRALGTLETLISAPVPLVLVLLPITLSTAIVGTYAMAATLLWGVILFDVPLSFAHPGLFVLSLPLCVLSIGMMGLLLTSTFVLMRNANAVANFLDYPIWLLSGMLVPISVLPSWTTPWSAVLPTTWSARSLHLATDGARELSDVLVPMGLGILVGGCYLVLSVFALAWVERRARAAATLSLV
ncbi:ABC transporter permease [Micromonospora sp. CPCC 206060]|uniref:ABC transporter permease n=1 Tax=Micromonospora sp. CPCC 206060 TaxID=3122406 RepID=UPI002FF0A28C